MRSTFYIYSLTVRTFLLSMLLLVVKNAAAQYTATATLDTNAILIGKQASLIIELKGKKTFPVNWPLITDTIGKIEVVSKGTIDTVPANTGEIHLKQTLAITAFDSGYFVIPPFAFNKPASGESVTETQPLLLTVQIMPVDTTKTFKDIKSIAEVPYDWRDYIWHIIIGLGVIILGIAGFIIYKRIKKNRKVPFLSSPKPEIPPHEIALQALEELDKGKHWQNGQYKFYHSSISDIIRNYIEKRWNVPAMEQTTDEILASSLSYDLDADPKQKLNYILRIADLAKFAKLQPLAHENEQAMREAKAFVVETKPAMAVATKEVGA